MQAEAGAMTAA